MTVFIKFWNSYTWVDWSSREFLDEAELYAEQQSARQTTNLHTIGIFQSDSDKNPIMVFLNGQKYADPYHDATLNELGVLQGWSNDVDEWFDTLAQVMGLDPAEDDKTTSELMEEILEVLRGNEDSLTDSVFNGERARLTTSFSDVETGCGDFAKGYVGFVNSDDDDIVFSPFDNDSGYGFFLNRSDFELVETFVYATRSRPPGFGTVPEGFRMHSEEQTPEYPYGQIVYDRKLTQDEIYRYELMPVSPNAYKYQIGDKVDWCGTEAIVEDHEWNRWILLRGVNDPTQTQRVREDDEDLYPWEDELG